MCCGALSAVGKNHGHSLNNFFLFIYTYWIGKLALGFEMVVIYVMTTKLAACQ